jgi:hypothetical protein
LGWGIAVGLEAPGEEKGEESLSDYSLENILWIYNNVDYISYLEAGSSLQAPSGMDAISLTEYADYFRQAAQRLGYDTV